MGLTEWYTCCTITPSRLRPGNSMYRSCVYTTTKVTVTNCRHGGLWRTLYGVSSGRLSCWFSRIWFLFSSLLRFYVSFNLLPLPWCGWRLRSQYWSHRQCPFRLLFNVFSRSPPSYPPEDTKCDSKNDDKPHRSNHIDDYCYGRIQSFWSLCCWRWRHFVVLLDTALDGIKPCSIPKLKET